MGAVLVDEYLLISHECLASIGNSFKIDEMLKDFLSTVLDKTKAKSVAAFNKKDLSRIISLGASNNNIKITIEDQNIKPNQLRIQTINENEKILIITYSEIICYFTYENTNYDLEKLGNIFKSYSKKIDTYTDACKKIFDHQNVKDRLELALQGANDGLWDWDIVNNQVFFSTRWKSMIGYQDNEIKNEFNEWLSRVHPDDLDETLAHVDNYIHGKLQKFENKHRLKHKDGHWVWILARAKAQFVNENAIRMVGFHTDISNQKDLEAQLEMKVTNEIEKNKQKDEMLRQQSSLAQMGEMISMIAHQWRQPLASIASIAVTIKLKIALSKFDLTTPNGIKMFVEYIENEIDDIESLVQVLTSTIDDFRNFYKPDKAFINTTIDSPIKKVLSILKPHIEQENITLNTEYLSLKNIHIYENEMVQVLLNIIKNSIDNFIDKKTPNPQINIKTEDIIGKVVVSICDNGGGIDPDILDLIFDPYFSTKSEKNGTGLGLYMSKTITEQHHNGNLSAKNTQNGICFYIILDKPLKK